jgi:hypothetical protein
MQSLALINQAMDRFPAFAALDQSKWANLIQETEVAVQ